MNENILSFLNLVEGKSTDNKVAIKVYEKYKNQLRDFENIVPNIFSELYETYRMWLYRVDIGYYVLGDRDCLPRHDYKDVREIYHEYCGDDLSLRNIYEKFYKQFEILISVSKIKL